MNAPVIDTMQEFRHSVYERMAAAGTGAEIDPIEAMEKRSSSFGRLLKESNSEQLIIPPTLLRHWIAADLTDFKDLDSLTKDKGAAILQRNEATYAAYADARRGVDEPFYADLKPSPKRVEWGENGFAPADSASSDQVKAFPKLTELLDNVTYRAQKDGSVLYLIDDKAAFTDHGHQILMAKGKENNDEAVLAAMMLAREKFGGKFDVTGTDDFKRYAITLMLQNGLSVELNSPALNALRDELATQLKIDLPAQRTAPAEQHQSEARQSTANIQVEPRPDSIEPQTKAAPVDRHTGTVLDFGSAPYEHKERNSKSFYVTLENSDGNVSTTWGVDLARAVEEQKVARGDTVTLNNLGKQPVTVPESILDDNGKVVGSREVETHRNTWEAVVSAKAPSPIVEADRVWLNNTGVPEHQLMAIPEYAALRAQDHAPRILFGGDETDEGKRHISSLMANQDYRAAFSATIDVEYDRLSKALQREAQESGFLDAAYKLLSDAEHKYGPMQKANATSDEAKPGAFFKSDVPGAIAVVEQVDRALVAAKAEAASATPSAAKGAQAAEVSSETVHVTDKEIPPRSTPSPTPKPRMGR